MTTFSLKNWLDLSMFDYQMILSLISAIAFTVYGVVCLTTNHMIDEFTRYGLLRFRTLTGILEALGGIGTIVGLYYSKPIYLISTGGLAMLMLLGVFVRLRISDPITQILPAFTLMTVNFVLFYMQLRR